ncbi:hypothetical protein ECAD30_40150 [Escherichia coli AD30]|nr:hypothetical protein ECAD30_40150 [Escherichia coli AD30]
MFLSHLTPPYLSLIKNINKHITPAPIIKRMDIFHLCAFSFLINIIYNYPNQ